MNSLRTIALGGSLLWFLLTTGCVRLGMPGGDRPLSPMTSASETSRVRTNLNSLTRGQQAYYLKYASFASTIEEIGLDLAPDMDGYRIAIADLQPTKVILTATPDEASQPKFSAGVFVVTKANGDWTTTIQCESEIAVLVPRLEGEEAICVDAQ